MVDTAYVVLHRFPVGMCNISYARTPKHVAVHVEVLKLLQLADGAWDGACQLVAEVCPWGPVVVRAPVRVLDALQFGVSSWVVAVERAGVIFCDKR